ncbi:MAG: hypothetical protein LBG65_07450 [Puniceicoccales bacterium]|nr:hypothetical protein [Puniceicoccales bacterium]
MPRLFACATIALAPRPFSAIRHLAEKSLINAVFETAPACVQFATETL